MKKSQSSMLKNMTKNLCPYEGKYQFTYYKDRLSLKLSILLKVMMH